MERPQNNNITELLKKPIWQLTGEEFVALQVYAINVSKTDPLTTPNIRKIVGVHAIAEYCECSDSQIAKLLREGVLTDAIVSRIGRKIVFDGDKARTLANEYQGNLRTYRKNAKKQL